MASAGQAGGSPGSGLPLLPPPRESAPLQEGRGESHPVCRCCADVHALCQMAAAACSTVCGSISRGGCCRCPGRLHIVWQAETSIGVKWLLAPVHVSQQAEYLLPPPIAPGLLSKVISSQLENLSRVASHCELLPLSLLANRLKVDACQSASKSMAG